MTVANTGARQDQVVSRVIDAWEREASKIVQGEGRGYYHGQTQINAWGDGHIAGFKLLQKITEPRGPYGMKLDMLDDLLASMPPYWGHEMRALFAGSLLRYMAELD